MKASLWFLKPSIMRMFVWAERNDVGQVGIRKRTVVLIVRFCRFMTQSIIVVI